MSEPADYGVLSQVVQAVGWLVSATIAIGLAWRQRASWEPSEQDVPKGGERVSGLIAAVALAIVFTQLNNTSQKTLLIELAVSLGALTVFALLTYGYLISKYTYVKVFSPATGQTAQENIIGGFRLTPAAQVAKEKHQLTIKELFKGSAYEPDKVWEPGSRAIAKQIFVLTYMVLVICGTIALACAGILLMLPKVAQAPAATLAVTPAGPIELPRSRVGSKQEQMFKLEALYSGPLGVISGLQPINGTSAQFSINGGTPVEVVFGTPENVSVTFSARSPGRAETHVVFKTVDGAQSKEIRLGADVEPLIVYLLDSRRRELVYNANSWAQGRSNADEIRLGLAGIPELDPRVESTSLAWTGYDTVLRANPDLVVIHWSAFEDRTIDPKETQARNRFNTTLKYLAKSKAHFLIYTRARAFNGETNRQKQVASIESLSPALKGRVHIFAFEQRADFTDAAIILALRTQIAEILGLS